MTQTSLSTMQRNALCQHFSRKFFTAEEVAALDYHLVAHLPKVGSKGIVTIRLWLQEQGFDLSNLPDEDQTHANRRLNQRLIHAARLLQKHGFKVEPPA